MSNTTTAPKSPKPAAKRPKAATLPWLKFNPAELAGRYSDLTDTEYGFFHRVIIQLWATPGNRMSPDDLRASLRMKPGSERETCLSGLIGYALKEDSAGLLFCPFIDEAFEGVALRTEAAKKGSAGRWGDGSASEDTPTGGHLADF